MHRSFGLSHGWQRCSSVDGTHEVVSGGFQGGAGMSKFYHFNPPKRENYRTEEEYEEALEEWEWAEDEYAEACRERRLLEDE